MSISVKQAVSDFLLSCKVEGKSYGTIECYSDKLKGFLWYCDNYELPDDIECITTKHLRELLAYLMERPGERVVRYGSTTAGVLEKYIRIRDSVNGHIDSLWITGKGVALKDSSVETLFITLSKRIGIHINPHLLRHTFSTLCLNFVAEMKVNPEKVLAKGVGKLFTNDIINDWLGDSGVSFNLNWDTREPKLLLQSPSVFGALGIQLL